MRKNSRIFSLDFYNLAFEECRKANKELSNTHFLNPTLLQLFVVRKNDETLDNSNLYATH